MQLCCANMHKMDWNDLRYVIAVAKEGSAAAAARALGVNHSTVVRRIKAFEESQAIRIFDHLASGYRLTDKGQIFLDAAQSIEKTIDDLRLKMGGQIDDLQGEVRITTTDGLYPLLVDVIAEFQQLYKGITIELIISNYQLNLKTMDADIAIRPALEKPVNLVSRYISGIAFAVYGTDRLKLNDEFIALEKALWLGFSEPLTGSAPDKWMSDSIPESQIKMRCNSFLTIQGLAENGVGYAVLPCYLADHSARLSRVLPNPLDLTTKIWLVSHSDILRSKRVLTCMDYLEERLKEKQSILEAGQYAS